MRGALGWKILKYMLEQTRPVSNRELSLACDAAVNTVRKELGAINEEAQSHGFQIASKPAIGNYVEILDERIAKPYLEHLYQRYERYQRMGKFYSPQTLYLVRRCISMGGQITVYQLCQELYCSMGTLQRELHLMRELLGEYGLRVTFSRKTASNIGGGVIVSGTEWDIRQCLIWQHKLFKNRLEEGGEREAAFQAMFFTVGNRDPYEEARELLMDCLSAQQDFLVPVLCIPKLVHYIELSISRAKYGSNLRFDRKQRERARGTAEYALAQRLYGQMEQRFGWAGGETDVLGLSMLILSFESVNRRISKLPEFASLQQEAREMLWRLADFWGYSRTFFEEGLEEDWILFLYTLKNRLIFRVYPDEEIFGYVKSKRIGTSDFCLLFARFYREKHGIKLGKGNVLGAFYFFHHLQHSASYCYYAQKIIVISQYGLACAKSLAQNIRRCCGTEVKQVTAVEIGEDMEEELSEADLLMTDLSLERRKYLKGYHLPILTISFSPGRLEQPELEEYLKRLQDGCEKMIIKPHSFFRTDCKSRGEILEWLAGLISDSLGLERERLVRHWQENDSYVGLERESGVVLLPVLISGMIHQEFAVLLNRRTISWNGQRVRIFVCYNRLSSLKANQILNGILRKFVHISPETAGAMLADKSDPLSLLYPCYSSEEKKISKIE